MISSKLERLKVDLYDSCRDETLLYGDWEKKYLNPFITLLIKEDQFARMGALVGPNFKLPEIKDD